MYFLGVYTDYYSINLFNLSLFVFLFSQQLPLLLPRIIITIIPTIINGHMNGDIITSKPAAPGLNFVIFASVEITKEEYLKRKIVL